MHSYGGVLLIFSITKNFTLGLHAHETENKQQISAIIFYSSRALRGRRDVFLITSPHFDKKFTSWAKTTFFTERTNYTRTAPVFVM